MNITQAELMAHPLMKQVTADLEKAKEIRESERVAGEIEQRRLRAEQGRYLREQFQAAADEYERLRVEAHAAVGRVWYAAQDYSRLTSNLPPGFSESTFTTINLPTLVPNPSPWSASSGFTTTQAAVASFFATSGKSWT